MESKIIKILICLNNCDYSKDTVKLLENPQFQIIVADSFGFNMKKSYRLFLKNKDLDVIIIATSFDHFFEDDLHSLPLIKKMRETFTGLIIGTTEAFIPFEKEYQAAMLNAGCSYYIGIDNVPSLVYYLLDMKYPDTRQPYTATPAFEKMAGWFQAQEAWRKK